MTEPVCARHPFDCSVEKHAEEWRNEALRLRAELAALRAAGEPEPPAAETFNVYEQSQECASCSACRACNGDCGGCPYVGHDCAPLLRAAGPASPTAQDSPAEVCDTCRGWAEPCENCRSSTLAAQHEGRWIFVESYSGQDDTAYIRCSCGWHSKAVWSRTAMPAIAQAFIDHQRETAQDSGHEFVPGVQPYPGSYVRCAVCGAAAYNGIHHQREQR